MSNEPILKVNKDIIYSKLYAKYDLQYIKDAGFFFDNAPDSYNIKDSLKILCTPLRHIKRPSIAKNCIVITSGAMCPAHDGHIEMMIAAKQRLEKEGFEVLGGFIAPDHDNYVSKKVSEYELNIEERLYLASKKIWQWEQQSWLSIDPWYGQFTPTDLNFTDLVLRTKLYVKEHLNLETTIFYVCGGDRANFSKSFELDEGCVIVKRPGATTLVEESNNIFIAELDNNLSSTELRNRLYYKFNKFEPAKKVKLRLDSTPKVPFISNYYEEVEEVSVSEQREIMDTLNLNSVISLDPCLKGENYLQVSRDFDIYGHFKSGYVISDNSLTTSIDKSKSYVLFDDDVYTGGTLRAASEYLKSNGIKVSGFAALSMYDPIEEIQDNRDFVLFEESGGLVISFKNRTVRAPYIFPFVDPVMRCSIKNAMGFSIDVWKFNLSLWENSDKTLADLSFTTIYELIGFEKSTKLKDICEYYYNYLTNIINYEAKK